MEIKTGNKTYLLLVIALATPFNNIILIFPMTGILNSEKSH